MKNIFNNLLYKYQSDIWQISKFGLVGVLNTIVDFGFFTFLYFFGGIHYLLSQAIAYGCATCHSYLWNRYWTFQVKKKPRIIEFVKFVAVNIFSLGVSLSTLFIFREIIGLNTLNSKVLTTFLTMIVNFCLNRFWVFKTKSNLDIN